MSDAIARLRAQLEACAPFAPTPDVRDLVRVLDVAEKARAYVWGRRDGSALTPARLEALARAVDAL